jgi:hypothetical protein
MAATMMVATTRLRSRREARCGAAVLAALMVVIHAFAMVHFVVHPHLLESATGRIVHPVGPTHEHRDPGAPSKHEPGEECQVLATLGQSTTLPSLGIEAAKPDAFWDLAPGTPVTRSVPSQRERYLLAPAQSPPYLRA